MQDKNQIGVNILVVISVVIIISVFVHFNKQDQPYPEEEIKVSATSTINLFATSTVLETPDSPFDIFAKCVASKNLVMYGAVWCAHCLNEKKAFGDSFKYINYVECPDNINLCIEKGINGYPTWIDNDGKKYEGEQGLSGIAFITGCQLPE